MYVIQALLQFGTAVLYAGYKSKDLIHFLPGEDGNYRLWWKKISDYENIMLTFGTTTVAVIDTPKRDSYFALQRHRFSCLLQTMRRSI